MHKARGVRMSLQTRPLATGEVLRQSMSDGGTGQLRWSHMGDETAFSLYGETPCLHGSGNRRVTAQTWAQRAFLRMATTGRREMTDNTMQ